MISSTGIKERAQELLKPFAQSIGNLGVSPNTITVFGFILALVAGVLIATENLITAAAVYLLSGLCDTFDGIVARITGKKSRLGAFLDSFLDRYADFFPLAGVASLAFKHQDQLLFALTLLAIAGSFATSYARARAEALGVECKVGIMERPERFVVLLAGVATGYLSVAMSVLALLSNVTAFQRLICAVERLR
ncbi:CDP-alcohol phosphatidyltransferase family protein [Thermovibrio ammonificans]